MGDSVLSVFMTTLDRELHFKPGSVIGSVILPLSYLPAFWLAWTGRGSLSLISQALFFALLTFVFYGAFIWLRMRWMFGLRWRYSGSLARRFLSFGALSGVAAFLSNMVSQTDNFVVGTRNGAAELGYYDRAYRTAQWPEYPAEHTAGAVGALHLCAAQGRCRAFAQERVDGDLADRHHGRTNCLGPVPDGAGPHPAGLWRTLAAGSTQLAPAGGGGAAAADMG